MHAERGLDVVRLNPGFVYGPCGLPRAGFGPAWLAGLAMRAFLGVALG